jgi:hypothetical protein
MRSRRVAATPLQSKTVTLAAVSQCMFSSLSAPPRFSGTMLSTT